MQKYIELGTTNIEYTLRISKRARNMRLAIYDGGDLVVTIPQCMSEKKAEKFILKKSAWIIGKVQEAIARGPRISTKERREQFLNYKEKARALVLEKLQTLNTVYGFVFNKIRIGNQKTRWGSCSRKGNLNFSYRIALLPEELVNYIIVHELCHLKEFNHSQNFWKLVERMVPAYKQSRKKLRNSKF